jgi:predicted phosphohydrolase
LKVPYRERPATKPGIVQQQEETMRIVAAADTHTFHDDLHSIPDGDLFVHAGDLCRGGRLEELRAAAAWLRTLPHRHKIVVAGNHDWCFVNEPQAAREILGSEIVYLQDAEAVIDGVRVWGSPWQPRFNDWAFNLPRGAALASRWALIPEGIHVLVTHGPPYGIGDCSGDPVRLGCRDLREAVRRVRPLLHLFGHIHQDGGVWQEEGVWFANVTTREGERGPTVIDLDVALQQVAPVSVPPRGDNAE